METPDPIRGDYSNVVYGLTTPLTTFNPIHSQIHHFVCIWQTMKEISSSSSHEVFKGKPFWFIWWNRLQVVFRGPGWNPFTQSMYECPQVLQPPSRNEMYNPSIGAWKTTLATLHFLILFVLSVFHLETDFSPMVKSGAAGFFENYEHHLLHFAQFAFIYLSLASLALVYEGEDWIFTRRCEILRCSVMLILLRCVLRAESTLSFTNFLSRIVPGSTIFSKRMEMAGGEVNITLAHIMMLFYFLSLSYWWWMGRSKIVSTDLALKTKLN